MAVPYFRSFIVMFLLPSWSRLYTNVFISDVLRRWLTNIPTLTPSPKVFLRSKGSTSQLPYKERLIWTALAAAVFLLLERCPAYGLREAQEDYLLWARPWFLSKSGTLLEMGTLPISITNIITWILDDVLDDIFDIHSEHSLKQARSAGITIFSSLVLSVCYVQSGLLNIQGGNTYVNLLVAFQLFCAAILVYYLQQVLTCYGVCCSFFSLSIVLSPCKKIFWESLSPVTLDMGRGPEFRGSILCFSHLTMSSGIAHAVQECLFRATQPNLMALISTVIMVMAFTYLKGLRVDIPVTSKEQLGVRGSFTIKLLYSSHGPFLAQYFAISQMKALSQGWYVFDPKTTNILYRLLGVWKQDEENPNELIAISGLCYWLTPPTWNTISDNQWQAAVYIGYILAICVITSHTSVHEGEKEHSPESVADDLLGPTYLTLAGKHEDSDKALRKEVCRLVSAATILGALAMGIICVICDIFEITGGGQSMLLAIESVHDTYDAWYNEQYELRKSRIENSLWETQSRD